MGKKIYVASAIVGVALTVAGAVYAFVWRGYFAFGGEYAPLLLPLFTWCWEDIREELADNGRSTRE